jgi:hypothetical protein
MHLEESFASAILDILVFENPPPLPEVLSVHANVWLESISECRPRTNVFYGTFLFKNILPRLDGM